MVRREDRPMGERLRTLQLPARPVVGSLILAGLVGLLLVDHAGSRPINPYAAPPPAALGSGQAPQGAHCTNL